MIEDSSHLNFEVNLSKILVFSVMIYIMDQGIIFLLMVTFHPINCVISVFFEVSILSFVAATVMSYHTFFVRIHIGFRDGKERASV